MSVRILTITSAETLPLRARFREEMNCQIVHDSIHRREGWTVSYGYELDGTLIGFGSVAVGGPWKEKPAILEFYLVPAHRTKAFTIFEAFLHACGARHFEAQTNEILFPVLVQAYGRNVFCEKIVFRDAMTTALPANGAELRPLTPRAEILESVEQRRGGGEWTLCVAGTEVGKGGILFHYNRPYGDAYMDVVKAYRRQGFGAYLVQELKRECYALGAVPAARCNPNNIASRQTLLRAGFEPVATILCGDIGPVK